LSPQRTFGGISEKIFSKKFPPAILYLGQSAESGIFFGIYRKKALPVKGQQNKKWLKAK